MYYLCTHPGVPGVFTLQTDMMKGRIEGEKRVVELMIRLYCRHKEGNSELCGGCAELLSYARQRLDRCPFANAKPTCRKCRVHCYRRGEREQIRRIMRWAGPRMLFFHPAAAVGHLLRELFARGGAPAHRHPSA